MRHGFIAFAFNQLENGAIIRRVVADLQTLAPQFRDDFLDRGGLMQLHQLAASAAAVGLGCRNVTQWQQLLPKFRIEQIEIEILMVKLPDRFFIRKIMNGLIIPFPHLDQIGRQLSRFGIAFCEISFEIAAMTPHRFAQLRQFLERFENVL